VVAHEGISGTHDLREEPLMKISHVEHSELQVLEERFDAKARANFGLREIGPLVEQFLGGLIELVQRHVALLVGGF